MSSTEIVEAAFREGDETMQKRKPYEVFEHTADVGIEAFGHTLPELFIHAAQGMESLMVAPEQIQESITREVAVEGFDVLSL